MLFLYQPLHVFTPKPNTILQSVKQLANLNR